MQKRGRKEKTTKKRNMVSDRHREENENTSLPPPPFVFGLFVCWLVGLFTCSAPTAGAVPDTG